MFRCTKIRGSARVLQVQLLFSSKYGKDFVSAATELTPGCGVNRQIIDLLSVQAPSQEKKLNLLKEIAVEHKLDWDPTVSETNFFKKHEDLMNGPFQFCSQCESKLPLPEEKHTEADLQSSIQSGSLGSDKHKPHISFDKKESKQSMTKTEANQDLQDVLASAETAAVRNNKLTKKNNAHVPDNSFENPFYASVANKPETESKHFTEQNTANDYDGCGINNVEFEPAFSLSHSSSFPSLDTLKEDHSSSLHNHSVSGFSYPNLFTSQNSNIGSHTFR